MRKDAERREVPGTLSRWCEVELFGSRSARLFFVLILGT
jgi:hypothetical protein